MELSSLILATFISSLGLIGGIIIAFLAKEELRPGEKYFLLAEDLILAATLLLLVMHAVFAPIVLGVISFLILILLIRPAKLPVALSRLRTSPVAFVLFALILAQNQQFTLFASLAFVYCIVAGTLLFMRQRQWWIGLILRMVLLVGFTALFQLV